MDDNEKRLEILRRTKKRRKQVDITFILAALAVLFLLASIFSPLFLTIPSFAPAPALIIVGFYMMGSIWARRCIISCLWPACCRRF